MEIDFAKLKVDPLRMYGGANGNKIGILYQGETYMLKFPPKPARNPDMSYTNSCISEYVACNIFKTLGIDTQETLLGQYNDKITVACKDFETDGFVLKDFAQLKNTIIVTKNEGCRSAFSVISDRIDLSKINSIVDNTPYISHTHKLFLKTMIKERKERIIDKASERKNSERH